jgi:hypothetical protein
MPFSYSNVLSGFREDVWFCLVSKKRLGMGSEMNLEIEGGERKVSWRGGTEGYKYKKKYTHTQIYTLIPRWHSLF